MCLRSPSKSVEVIRLSLVWTISWHRDFDLAEGSHLALDMLHCLRYAGLFSVDRPSLWTTVETLIVYHFNNSSL